MEAHVYPEGCTFNSLEDIKDKKIVVMGLGLNGGGQACVKFFLKHGAFVIATDMKKTEELKPTIDAITQDKSIDHSHLMYVLGEHRIDDFEDADCVIKNPGVKFQGNKFLEAAKAIESDLSIFLKFTKAPVIAVTGSKGKSSTASAIYHGLQQCGFKCFLGGNITVSPLTFLEETNENTPVVLELSSWQLADLRGRKLLKPKISVITKIVPDHQNWYGEMDAYVKDKELIFADQDASDYCILDFDEDKYQSETKEADPAFKCWGDLFASKTKAKVFRYSKNPLPENVDGVFQKADEDGNVCGYVQVAGKTEKIMGQLQVPGDHMKTNVLNAALCLYLMKIPGEKIVTAMATWKGIPHRLERFHEWQGQGDGRKVIFFNDSASTVPEAAAAASQSFGQSIVLICGGTDKNLDFIPLARTLMGDSGTKYPPKEIYLLAGTGTDKLTDLLDKAKVQYNGPFDSLDVLLKILKSNLQGANAANLYGEKSLGDLPLVFSPGATSFGMFQNEFDRGDKFKAKVKEIFS